MGNDKASMKVAGIPLISRVIRASGHVGPVQIIGGPPSLVPLVHAGGTPPTQLSHRPDSTQDPGPFGAIVDALGDVSTPLALVLSCLSMVYFGMVVVCITPNMQMGLTMGATILVRPQHLGFSGSCASMCQQAFAHYVYCKA